MTSSPEPALLRGRSAATAAPYRRSAQPPPQPPAGRPSLRLSDVYADELGRLRRAAEEEGYAAGYAAGRADAEEVVAESERAAKARLGEVQVRWERRMASATAALGAAAARLEEVETTTADEVRDTVLSAALTLLGDLLGRELELARTPGLDALRRALTLVPADAPAVVRLHPDDLEEVPIDSLVGLPASVKVVPDETVERAGAVAECGARRIDAQLSTALVRVRSVLKP
jgi:flagellar assembly protein FliH